MARLRNPGLLVGLVFALVGLVFVGVGATLALAGGGPDTDSTVQGEVVETDEETSTRRRTTGTNRRTTSTTCGIVAEYVVDGQTYTVESATRSSSNCDYAPGDAIEVRYAADDPAQADVGEGGWLGWLFAGIGCLLLLGGGAGAAFAASRRRA